MFSQNNHQMLSYGSRSTPPTDHHRWKPSIEIAPNCPRCDSANTKFCYYNNYSLTQPRYFCKGCRRYWTKGGSLRNIPIGGGCRKNRRAKSSNKLTSSSPSATTLHTDNIRPDQALDDMFDNYRKNSDSETSKIDMSIIYARYLSQVPHESFSFGQVEEENLGFISSQYDLPEVNVGDTFAMNLYPNLQNSDFSVQESRSNIPIIQDWNSVSLSGFEAF